MESLTVTVLDSNGDIYPNTEVSVHYAHYGVDEKVTDSNGEVDFETPDWVVAEVSCGGNNVSVNMDTCHELVTINTN